MAVSVILLSVADVQLLRVCGDHLRVRVVCERKRASVENLSGRVRGCWIPQIDLCGVIGRVLQCRKELYANICSLLQRAVRD